MKNHITIAVFTIFLAALACCAAWPEGTREVTLGHYLVLRVRCDAGGYTIDQRVIALQERANDLLRANKTTMTFSVRMSGADANIYTDHILFMTVTPEDAKANGTTAEKLANIWAQRLRTVFPKSDPDSQALEGLVRWARRTMHSKLARARGFAQVLSAEGGDKKCYGQYSRSCWSCGW